MGVNNCFYLLINLKIKMNSMRVIQTGRLIQTSFRRNFGAASIASQKASDPIQQLFLEKVREYKKKSESSSDGLFEASADIKNELDRGLTRAATQYGGSGDAMTKFPDLKFQEPAIVDPQDI